MQNENLLTDASALDLLREVGLGSDIEICIVHGKKLNTLGSIEGSYGKSIKEKIEEVEATTKEQHKAIKTLEGRQEKIAFLEENLKKANQRISILQKRIKDMQAEHQTQDECYMTFIAELTEKVEQLEGEKESVFIPSVKGEGKTVELGPRKLQEAIKLYAMNMPYTKILKKTGISKGQANRLFHGKFKSAASKKKVLTEINQLLKVNQNPKILEKLKSLNMLYSDGGSPDDKDRVEPNFS